MLRSKKCKSNNLNLGDMINAFPLYNDDFGILNDIDNSLIMKDSFGNSNNAFNQARIEDITFMEYDIVPSTLRTHVENDLEPLNAELLLELLNQNEGYTDLEALLQRPFHKELDVSDKRDSDINLSQSNRRPDVDIDIDTNYQVDKDLGGNSIIENSYPLRDSYKEIHTFVDFNLNADDAVKIKSSCAIEEVEFNKKTNEDVVIELEYSTKKSHTSNKFVNFQIEPTMPQRRVPKRKSATRSLIVDNVITIGHQVIRDNMNKSRFCLVDKNSLFPNALISRSLKAQIACSAANLFQYPGSSNILRSRELLSFWMKRKQICQDVGTPLSYHEDVVVPVQEHQENANEVSDMSIEQVRRRDSSKRATMLMDSINLGSDSLQKSIAQISFDADRTLDDENKHIFDDPVVHPVDVSMLPIIEEDIVQRHEEKYEEQSINKEVKMVDKSGVWRMIKEEFKKKLGGQCPEEDVRVSFHELCPVGSLKKNAAIFFITILRLAKYKKIRLFQDKYDSEIWIGLPSAEDVHR